MKLTQFQERALQRAISGDAIASAEEREALAKLYQSLLESKSSLTVRPQSRVKVDDDARKAAVEKHLRALKAAGTDRRAFDSALSAAMSDRNVTAREFRDLAAAFTGRKIRAKETRAGIEKLMIQAFNRDLWQEEAYRRIEKLTAAE